ncbi:MAG TPA: DivIVA domain-containing protein [candidate division Zixibacteria bacterium]|nr:DivIVA domain-containing protein [candidate division Zixibacteria bacterium]
MALSPTDIRNFEYTTQMRGYNKEEVDDFMEQVASALEEAKQENLKLSMQADSLKTQLEGLRQFEDTIKNAAIDARRNADQTLQQARNEAEKIVTEARREAERLVGDKEKQLEDIESRTEKADLVKRAYIGKLQDLIESHLDMVKALAQSMPTLRHDEEESVDEDPDRIQVTDSNEVERDGMSTIGSHPIESESNDQEESKSASNLVQADELSAQEEQPAPTEVASQADSSLINESETPTNRTEIAESQPVEEDKPVDPELAAALERYQSGTSMTEEPSEATSQIPVEQTDQQPANEVSEQPSESTHKIPDGFNEGIIETNTRAEDIPPEFIVKKNGANDPNATDRLDDYVEDRRRQQVLDADKKVNRPSAEPPDPEKLAEELDAVAAKFEEEMDRAASN